MSETVSEFMEKPHTKYACGKREEEARQTLTAAFCASSEDKAKREGMMFEALVEAVMETRKGRETLTELSELGYTFAFEVGNFDGMCMPKDKKILLNPYEKIERLMTVIVHEGRHAIQAELTAESAPAFQDTQVASYYKKSRAIEADATAHEMAFIYETRDVDPAVYQHAAERNLPMFRAFVDEMDKSGDEKKAMQASFEAWYETPRYIDFYDKFHKERAQLIVNQAVPQNYTDAFSKEYRNEDILKMCLYDGKPYINPEFLDSKKAFSLAENHKKDLEGIMESYEKAVPGAGKDRSFLKMYSRGEDRAAEPVRADKAVPPAAKLSAVMRRER